MLSLSLPSFEKLAVPFAVLTWRFDEAASSTLSKLPGMMWTRAEHLILLHTYAEAVLTKETSAIRCRNRLSPNRDAWPETRETRYYVILYSYIRKMGPQRWELSVPLQYSGCKVSRALQTPAKELWYFLFPTLSPSKRSLHDNHIQASHNRRGLQFPNKQ